MSIEPRTEIPAADATETPPDLEFAVLGARPVKYAAAPMLTIDLQVSEPDGREVYMVAVKVQLMIEPARRRYDDATRGRLIELFGAPERWAVTTRSLVWAKLDVLVPAFTGTTTVTVPIACHYDLELAAAKYLDSLPDGEAPLALHFNGMIYYPARRRRPADGADPVVEVDRLPHAGVGVAGDDRALLPGNGLDRGPLADFRGAPAGEARARTGHPRRVRQRTVEA